MASKFIAKRLDLEGAEVLFSFLIQEGKFGSAIALRLTEAQAKMLKEVESKLLAEAKPLLTGRKQGASIVKENLDKDGNPDGHKLVITVKDVSGIPMVNHLAEPLTVDPTRWSIVNLELNLRVYELLSGVHGVKVYLNDLQVAKLAVQERSSKFKPIIDDDSAAF